MNLTVNNIMSFKIYNLLQMSFFYNVHINYKNNLVQKKKITFYNLHNLYD